MKILSHFLFDDKGKQVPYKPSPNVGGTLAPTYLIMHYTASSNATGAISWMLSPQSKVSAHLHLDRDGNFVQLVPFNRVAWHAGKSEWKGIVGMNSHSIGIEIQNTGTQEYTKAQMDALSNVSKVLFSAYPIKEILGHSDISPGRKQDPGPQFPMKWLREQVMPIKTGAVPVKITTADLNLRSGAGTNHKVISVLPKGTEVNVLSVSGDWSNIFVCSNKLIGYASSKYLR